MHTENDIESVLEQRGKAYGPFYENAEMYEAVMAELDKIMDLHLVERMAIRMIVLKIVRIVCGGGGIIDSWTDIEGFARLGKSHLEGESE